MRPPASPLAVSAVEGAVTRLRNQAVTSVTALTLFEAENDAAWDAGLMLSSADVWEAVYGWAGYDSDGPPPDNTPFELT